MMQVGAHHRVQGLRIKRSRARREETLLLNMHVGGLNLRITEHVSGSFQISPQATLITMPLLDQIQKDMTAAIKSSEQTRLDALRMIKTALQKHKVDTMKDLDEQTEIQILTTLIKQRRESADMFRKGNRPELAEREETELKLIESYMPSAPTDAEVEAAIAAAMAET